MAMPLEKAKEVLIAYKAHNYNAAKALPAVGYSRETANAQSTRTLESAVRTVAASGDQDAILEWLGMTPQDLAREYGEIIKQNKNFPAKLRALEPLLRAKGIAWTDDQSNKAPLVNITMKAPTPQTETHEGGSKSEETAQQSQNATSHNIHCATRDEETKKIEVRSGIFDPKEEGCPPPKIAENIDLDKSEENQSDIPPSFTDEN